MSWTYLGPGNSAKDAVRFWIQDVDITNQRLSDEDINYLIAQFWNTDGHELGIAARAAELLASRYAAEVNVSGDGLSVDVGSLQQRYNDLATSLRDQLNSLPSWDAHALVYDLTDDPNVPPLNFAVGMNDHPEVGRTSYPLHFVSPLVAQES